MKTSHLLILGSPRSGTTLLAAMLSCHPDIAILNEEPNGMFDTILSKKLKGVKLCIPNQIELDSRERIRHRLIRSIPYFGRFFKFATNKGGPLSVRDFQKFPDIKILAIIRNPYKNIDSIQKRGRQDYKIAQYRWARAIEILYQIKQEDDNQVVVISFNDLVKDPEGTIKKTLEVLGYDFVPQVLDGYKYTPQYQGNTAIIKSKGDVNDKDILSHEIFLSNPKLRDKFLFLRETAI